MKPASERKPLTQVAGRPLIDHVLDQCHAAGIEKVVVDVGADGDGLLEHIARERRFPGGVVGIATARGCGTGGSLHALVSAIGGGPCLISAVDTIAPPGAYARLLSAARERSEGVLAVVMVTSHVDDEEPIWVRADPVGRIVEIAKNIAPTGVVFGNVRWLSAAACAAIRGMRPSTGERDMKLMARLLAGGNTPMEVHFEDPVFDVDDAKDLRAAERWLEGRKMCRREADRSDTASS
jgi:NDP-sugar pyrophosphorylase family protein